MSKLDWQWPLAAGETLLWQGRPAPRCYTFRNWKLALAGTALFLACSFWMMLGLQLEETGEFSILLILLPAPLVIATFLLGPGYLILSRWRWENIYYALTDRRVLMRGGLLQVRVRAYSALEISGWQQKRFGEQLASIRILRGKETPLIFACLEHPQTLTQHFPQHDAGQIDGESV